MKTIYLISTTLLKENSAINNNVDDTLLLNAILEAQEIELQQTLGSRLYNRILNDIDNDSLSGDYKTLVDDYCQKVVVYYATARAIPYVHYKIVNKGVNSQSSENSTPTAFNEMNFLMKKVENDAEYFNQRLADYLHQNRDKFPEYTEPAGCDEIKPNRSSYRSALVLDEPSCPKAGLGYNFFTVTL